MKAVSENIVVFYFKIRTKVMSLRLSPLDTLVKSASNTTLNIIGKINIYYVFFQVSFTSKGVSVYKQRVRFVVIYVNLKSATLISNFH